MQFSKSISNNRIERLELQVSNEGYLDPNYGHGATLSIRQGWNESCAWQRCTLSVNELRDIIFLCEQALKI